MNVRRPTSLLLLALTAFAPSLVAAQVPEISKISAARTLPARISDADFWKTVTDISEPGGYFRIADNFTSNEMEVGDIFTTLRTSGITGGVYIGVGPEQNLSYIAAIRPKMAFIIDIRRQAVMQHLMFKAMFELAPDRADFLSLLFARPRPPGLDSTTSISAMWTAYWGVVPDTALARKNSSRVESHIVKTHGFTLTTAEVDQLRYVIESFQRFGPGITTQGGAGGGGRGGGGRNFADMTGASADQAGVVQSFLSTEENYRFVRSLQERNLLIPVSGNFGGPKALRGIGTWIREHGGVVSAYYVSNVEQYLFQDGLDRTFYDNVATLPVDAKSVFIRPYSMRFGRGGGGFGGPSKPLCPIADFLKAVADGKITSNNAALACS